jgi:hypothetical protein
MVQDGIETLVALMRAMRLEDPASYEALLVLVRARNSRYGYKQVEKKSNRRLRSRRG